MIVTNFRILVVCACAAASASGAAHATPAIDTPPPPCAADCRDEKEPFLNAATLVDPALLSGPDFRVVPEVRVRGYMADFVIDTAFGPLRADSVELLAVRIGEMPALATLDRASKTGAFARALAERGRKTGAAIVNVIAHPIDTITGLPAGVARYFRKQLDTWGNRAQSLADQTARHAENDGDPFRAPPGPMTAHRDDAPDDAEPKKNRAWYARVGSETERQGKRLLKYAQERRAMAKLLGIDPGTTNPLLNDRLDALAWAAVGGNFSAGEALATVTGTAATVISGSSQLNEYVLQQTPEQLRETLHRRLLALCSDDDSIRSFLHRGAFTDTLRVALVESLEQLKPQQGCNELLELAATTRGEVEARYLVDALKLVRHGGRSAGGSLVVSGAALAWRAADGKLVLPLPVDYLSWTRALGEFFDQREFAVTDKTALISGAASTRAQRELTERGWNLALRAPYEGAPTYSPMADVASAMP